MIFAWHPHAFVGGMMLSAGFMLMTDSAGAAAPSTITNTSANTGSTTSWDKNLPSDSRFTVLSAFGGAAVRPFTTCTSLPRQLPVGWMPRPMPRLHLHVILHSASILLHHPTNPVFH